MVHSAPPTEVAMLIAEAWRARASDLLLTAGSPPLLRVDGNLTPAAGHEVLNAGDTDRIATSLLTDIQRERFAEGHEIDFSFGWGDNLARVRGNAFRQREAAAIALRIIPHAIPTFDEINLPPVVRDFAWLSQGLVLMTGPTGSGKSTTLASLIDAINAQRPLHIVTIEDPIEYVHDHRRSAVSQREVGVDTPSFAQALRSALREDPDVILVGEMRDLESIRFALTLAETGHLVLATLHTNDTAQAVDRLVDVFPAEQQPQIRVQLANTLSAIVHQRLVPLIGGGRVAAHEVLIATPPVRNLVKEGKSTQLRNQILIGQSVGMQSLEVALSLLIRHGAITVDDAIRVSAYPQDIDRTVAPPPVPPPAPARSAV